MTDEELKEALQTANEVIKKLEDPARKLTKQERRQGELLWLKRDALNRIKAARTANNMTQELQSTLRYNLLNNFGEKHFRLAKILASNVGWDLLQM